MYVSQVHSYGARYTTLIQYAVVSLNELVLKTVGHLHSLDLPCEFTHL